ncbi:methylaspartate mutase [Streptomyces lavendulae]|nr:methylaspartate mutase [Streptomyces lavendulae]TXJ86742.1 methylaspartate mutase [Streptomyces lavendulae]
MDAPISGGFGAFVRGARELVVQPRMGFGSPERMRRGLLATRDADATAVGTLTLDSYTRVGDLTAARQAVAEGTDLNGYPILTHGPAATRRMLDGIDGPAFPVQVRHGSAAPQNIVRGLLAAKLHATEGGPVSYCLPYSRTPLADAVDNWARSCELLAEARRPGVEPHLESFGGCMMGQLCPPGLLVALSVLEGMFFVRHGLRSISLSYAQQTDPQQDEEAVRALRALAADLLPGVDWHIVVYTYMGVYPRTPSGARALQDRAVRLAVRAGAQRLIVKTTVEARRIPTIAENIAALETSAHTARTVRPGALGAPDGGDRDSQVYAEARALVEAVLCAGPDIGRALLTAFDRGWLDVPYCLHPDNAGRSAGFIDERGRLGWSSIGAMPIGHVAGARPAAALTSSGLLDALHYVETRLDLGELAGAGPDREPVRARS